MRLFSAKQVGDLCGVSRDTVKETAKRIKLEVAKSGARGDWQFTEEQVARLKPELRKVAK